MTCTTSEDKTSYYALNSPRTLLVVYDTKKERVCLRAYTAAVCWMDLVSTSYQALPIITLRRKDWGVYHMPCSSQRS